MSGLGELSSLAKVLGDYRAAREGQETQTLSDLIQEAAGWATLADQVRTSMAILSEGGISLEDCPRLENLPGRAEKLHERLVSEWRRYKHGGHYKTLHEQLKKTLRAQQRWVRTAWTEFCEEAKEAKRTPSVLDRVGRFRSVIDQIRTQQQAVSVIQSEVPSADRIEKVRTIEDQIRQLADSLDWDILGKRVQDFIDKSVRDAGVSAEVFRDPKLVEDLDEHGLLDDFVVKPRSSSL